MVKNLFPLNRPLEALTIFWLVYVPQEQSVLDTTYLNEIVKIRSG